MAKPSRIRRIAIIVVAAPFALLLVAIIVAAFLFLTFTDRWAKPTDFPAQFEAMTRAHLGIAPNHLTHSRPWRAIQDEITEVHAARVENFQDPTGARRWPRNVFYQSATPEDLALRNALYADLLDRQIFLRLDQLASDPRIVLDRGSDETLDDITDILGATTSLAKFSQWQAWDLTHEGDIDAAIAHLTHIHTLARLTASTPTIIHQYTASTLAQQLLETAVDVAQSPWLTSSQARLIADLIQHAPLPDFRYALEGERLMALDRINERLKPRLIIAKDSRAQMRKVDEIVNELQSQIAMTIDQRRKAEPEWGVSHKWNRLTRIRFLPASWGEPSLIFVRDRLEESQLVKASTILTIAIIRYRLDHSGELPPSLDALVPTYLAELPNDPFSGKPPLYVKGPVLVPQSGADIREGTPQTTAPFMLYSVGFDGVDNAAKLDFDPRMGLRAKGAGHDYILYPRAD